MKYYTNQLSKVQSLGETPKYQKLHDGIWLDLIPRFDYVGGQGNVLTYQVEGALYGYGHSDVEKMLTEGSVIISKKQQIHLTAPPSEMAIILSEAA